MKQVNIRRWEIPFGFILRFLISEGCKYHPSRDPTQYTGLIPICFPTSIYKLSWFCLLFMLTGAGLIQVPRMSYLELRKSSLSLCLSLSPIFTNTLASHLFKPMASYVGLSPGQGTKMAHSMGQLSLCAAPGSPCTAMKTQDSQTNKQTKKPNNNKNQPWPPQQDKTFHYLAQSIFTSLLNPFPHIHFKLIIVSSQVPGCSAPLPALHLAVCDHPSRFS